ncbi:MAG: cytochrome b/b6 domain-containing protein [Telluria sp.]
MELKKVRIWDLPTRLFHWSLALLVFGAIITERIGGSAIDWHFRIGYAILALLFFRLVWGFIGSRYARFASFIFSPKTIFAYATGKRPAHQPAFHGHNPVGSLSVFALLIVVLAQTGSGLFANDDIASEGPLMRFISKEMSDSVTWFHAQIGGNLIYALVGLHIAAIAFYLLRKKINLIKPMITGDKPADVDAVAALDNGRLRMTALFVVLACSVAVYFIVNL